ncbi:OmpA family protein, partial [Bacteroides sp. 51]|nr:OmpA family protein [Bacteroides sp. 51]
RRANAVADYLKQNGVAYNQFQAVQGVGYDQYDLEW